MVGRSRPLRNSGMEKSIWNVLFWTTVWWTILQLTSWDGQSGGHWNLPVFWWWLRPDCRRSWKQIRLMPKNRIHELLQNRPDQSYSEAWWFLRWYCLLGLIWPKTCFPTQRECLVSGNPTFSTTSHRTTTSAGVDFWRVWNLEWKSFCFLFLCFYQLVVCVFFVFVHFLFCHLLLYACPFVFFHVFVYESTLIVSFTFIGLFSVSNF